MSLSFSKVRQRSLKCLRQELSLNLVLEAGQSFRWRKNELNEWTGVFAGKVWKLFQDDHSIQYKTIPNSPDQHLDDENQLKNYLQLDVNLQKLYEEWSRTDKWFAEVAKQYPGIRVLRQDPVECLFSFLCSSNNNITRITDMVNKMCTLFGQKIATIDGQDYHDFPRIESLAADIVEQTLRVHKFGYRASYIHRTAKQIAETGRDHEWLSSLRHVSYDEAHTALVAFPGIGHKVADCVCLMSLDKPSVVPIDTHIFKVVAGRYLPSLKAHKSLTDSVYKEIGSFFCRTFGSYAGWAQSVLFVSDLSKFKAAKVAPRPAKRTSRKTTKDIL